MLQTVAAAITLSTTPNPSFTAGVVQWPVNCWNANHEKWATIVERPDSLCKVSQDSHTCIHLRFELALCSLHWQTWGRTINKQTSMCGKCLKGKKYCVLFSLWLQWFDSWIESGNFMVGRRTKYLGDLNVGACLTLSHKVPICFHFCKCWPTSSLVPGHTTQTPSKV